VLFVRLDRITRLGAGHAHAFFDRLDAYGVAYKSLNDPWLDSNIPMVRDILISVMATFAKNERETLISRTQAGLARARAEGKVLGRPACLAPRGPAGHQEASQAGQVTASDCPGLEPLEGHRALESA
jgi:DNA invertase Pin-like site-specific DNA recombinase